MTTTPPDDGRLTIPEDASDAEAAAIGAAIGAYLRDRERAAAAAAAASGGDETDWQDRKWQFAGRTEALSGRAHRVPSAAPRDNWTAAARLEGLD